jgi:hypothetical protein
MGEWYIMDVLPLLREELVDRGWGWLLGALERRREVVDGGEEWMSYLRISIWLPIVSM